MSYQSHNVWYDENHEKKTEEKKRKKNYKYNRHILKAH